MKKMFGVLSFIAILTVSFTAQASPSVNGDPPTVVFDIGFEPPMVMDVVIVPMKIEVLNVAEFSVNCNEAKEDLSFVLGNDYTVTVEVFSDLPSDYGSRSSTDTHYNFNCSETITPYFDAHEPVGWCNTNKLT